MTSLFLNGPDEIRKYSVSAEHGRVNLAAQANLPNSHALAQAPDGIYCAARGQVLRCNYDLEIRERRDFGDVGALTALPSGEALVSVDGTLLVLDPELREIGRLEITGDGKNAHDLLVRGAYVYVLDNVVYPALLWILNLSEPAHPTVLHAGEVQDIYPHLVGQLVPPGAGVWLVFQSGVAEGGSWQHLHVFSAFDGQPLRERARLTRRMRPWWRDAHDGEFALKPPPRDAELVLASLTHVETGDERPGLEVFSLDCSGSGWAVLADEHGGRYTGELKVERGELIVRHLTPAREVISIVYGESHIYTLAYDEERTEGVLRVVSRADGFVRYHGNVGPGVTARSEAAHWNPAMLLAESDSRAE